MITVYTVAYNEELMIQFMIDHYRERFPGCRIVVNDNISTDRTVKIALANDCEVIPFDTNNQFQDRRHMEIKNSCWKDATTDWVLMCDIDELLDINEAQLKKEEKSGTTIIGTETYDMVNMENNFNLADIKYGVRSPIIGKSLLFNKKYISEINYGPGAHECRPIGTVTYSNKAYKLYHHWSINEDVTIEKFKTYSKRLSPENIKNGWSTFCLMTPEEIREEYVSERKKAVKIR